MDMLKKLRDRIDWLDTQIVTLLDERMKASDQIGKIKKIHQLNLTDESREKCVLDRIENIVQHPVLKESIANIYKEVMQESRIAQQFYQVVSIPFRRIGIIGLGLIGGSICKGIKTKDSRIEIGTMSYDSEDVTLARQEGWVDKEYNTLADLLRNSELLILASPISTIAFYAEEIKNQGIELEKLFVIDIASVKGEIVAAFERLSNDRIEYLSTHPMAGKEFSGFANSQATLFINRPWVIIPHEKNSSSGLDGIKELIQFLGSVPVCLEAAVHDRQAALVSHLPAMLAKTYFDFVRSIDPESIEIGGPGFEAFTRLAHDNPEMHLEIQKNNQKIMHDYLDQWLRYLKKIKGN